MLYDQNQVLQLRVIKRSDQFRIAQRLIQMREHGLIASFKTGDEVLEPLTAQGQGKGGWHGIQMALGDTIVTTATKPVLYRRSHAAFSKKCVGLCNHPYDRPRTPVLHAGAFLV
jgi:hypothetical protein